MGTHSPILYPAMADRVLHIVKVGTVKIGINEPDNYANIATIVGVTKATDSDVLDDEGTIGGLKKRGKLVSFRVKTKDKKSHTIQCSIDKVSTAVATLKGKTFAGSVISSVSIPRKRSRY
jgi:hypothetical protein